ncbi:amidohydrolase [Amycolatopsis jejuensis]|uniref:amidohydrolase n=1 Tax=Amycolatopsis jejuensis TaxID=330084 RepID=UPI000524FF7B|nr:amidohydrolase [Amycolatopsis jejuensis]
MAPELLLTNATVYTVDDDRPWTTSVAVENGKVSTAASGPDTEVRDLDGAFVLPGFVDVHSHHALAGRELFELRLKSGADLPSILAAVREWSAGLAPDEWIVGGAWPSTLAPELGNDAVRRALDEAAGGRPVVLIEDSRHNRWVSSRALELAGITESTPDPAGGSIHRDLMSGTPTGLLIESAGLVVERAMRKTRTLTAAQHAEASRRAIEILHSYGITAFQDAGASLDILTALKTLDDAGELAAWVVSSMLVNDPIFGADPIGAPLLERAAAFRTEHHRPDFVKIFLDGTPPAHTAAFLEPYLHHECFCGETTMPPEELAGWLDTAARAGLSAKIHCAGDSAVRSILDAAATLRAGGDRTTKIQVAHGQFIHPEDLERFATLDVSADISPFLWVPGVIPDAIAQVLPPERASRMQPNRTLLDTGALVAGGSDWPVSESPNAWEGIEGLVTRRDPHGKHPGSLWPEQAITLAEAIRVFTLNSARACGLDDVTGSLTPGKSADFVILDRDPFQTPADDLADITVQETWFAGRQVYRRPS